MARFNLAKVIKFFYQKKVPLAFSFISAVVVKGILVVNLFLYATWR